jgi:hypothetical protein
MRDEIFDRSYQTGREELHAGIDRLFGRIAEGVRVTFDAIHRVEWSAPWQKDPKKDCTGLA